MKFLGFAILVLAGFTAYWAITGKIAGVGSDLQSLPNAGGTPASTTPIPGTQGGSAAAGSAPESPLAQDQFPNLYPQTSSLTASGGTLV